MQERSDLELLSSAVHGRRDPFGELFDRHGESIYRYAWSLTRDMEDARDVVQEVFLIAWRKRDVIGFVSDSALPWLLATCRHVGLNSNRSRRRNPVTAVDPAVLIERESVSEPEAESRDELDALFVAIRRLDHLDQEICRLCIIEGRTYAAAADQLGVTASTVGKRLERLRRRLRQSRAEYREATS